MRKILVTEMSGTGKSSALAELARRGYYVVETDRGGWSEWSDHEGGYVWREDRIGDLLAREHSDALRFGHRVQSGALLPSVRCCCCPERPG